MSMPNPRVRRGTITTPPPRPVREPRNPAISEPMKSRPVSSRMFNGISVPLSQCEAKDGRRQLGHSTLARLLAHGDCLGSGWWHVGMRQRIHHRGSAWRVYWCCGAIIGDACERSFYLRCGADAIWAVWRGALDGAGG